MASKFHQGVYIPTNPDKYIGKGSIKYRSGWERQCMLFFDNHPSVLQWASESISIPYLDPITGRKKNYIPDFLVIFETKDKQKLVEMVEVKPSKETGITQKKRVNSNTQLIIARNHSKWSAAMKYCEKNGINFRVITELELFGPKGKK